ncbi:glycosyltransferase [Marinovum sp. 2_MG-2023]|uniref:glycosyltransferase n=1 Tax=unclassified Marinovum TaxID=2647166 RepID=UPI0026E1E883|nr:MULTISPECIES: glycosyltransferase [unclassified Marinovum]MDO6729557.1 glycosyltransferase [Marinovum sp. 2_MG-2023]MDO6780289.1 glycosyltransferase [Marinovum sp. 1_MG-2023]
MSPSKVQLRGPQTARLSPHYRQPLGQILVDTGVLTPDQLLLGLGIQAQCHAPLPQVLLAEGLVTGEDILRAQSAQYAALSLTVTDTPPNADCYGALDPLFCLKHGIMPWDRLGETLVVATCHPDQFEDLLALLPDQTGPVVMGIASETDIHAAIAAAHAKTLSKLAETALPEEDSCRGMRVVADRRDLRRMALLGIALATVAAVFPALVYGVAAAWAIFTLFCITYMKAAACIARLRGPLVSTATGSTKLTKPPPKVSMLVPLFREKDIATRLVARLSRLTYPKSRLDVVLLLEAEDTQTQAALDKAELPPWMRILVVPPGELTTKPRALNYGIRFCDGEILGIYDAEDNPAPDQIDLVAAHFETAPDDVACLQGILDFYNPHANWLARCFTIEYASWFRVILPGLTRMRLPIPLGGTTLFCRRQVLEDLGGWDAHNVTEDADLGIRLSRHGFRTQMIDSVTLEEANCALWPWVRQRSRWLKGYMATYRVHMRHPRVLLRDLGWRGFIGFQVLFLGALSQFVMAPVLWSFWLAIFGLPHPLVTWFGPDIETGIKILFLLTEALGLTIGMAAVASPQHRRLIPWVPTLMFYFPLGSIAAYKALIELINRPFFWDKTDHGHSNDEPVLDHEEVKPGAVTNA